MAAGHAGRAMVGGEAMIAIGVGCRRGVGGAAIAALVTRARSLAAVEHEAAVLFSHERKRDEAGLIAAAAELGLSLQFLPVEVLREVEGRVETGSAVSAKLLGVTSVSEAAALAGAGSGARLVLPRIADGGCPGIAPGVIDLVLGCRLG